MQNPEKEEEYQRWKEAEEDLELWYCQVVGSDFCEEGDIRKPSKEMVRETIRSMDTTHPGWRDTTGGNALALILAQRYPELERRRKA